MKFYKPALLLPLLLFVSSSCRKPVSLQPGKYTSSHYSIMEKYLMALSYNVSKISTDSDLQVNPDSTFTYTVCGQVHTGTWEQNTDSLLLHVDAVRWSDEVMRRPDSKVQQPDLPTDPIAFRISGKRLEQMHGNWVKVLEYKFDKGGI